jgi:hypothetical protein
MQSQADYIEQLAELLAEGKTITLLCSSACEDPTRCHRTPLQELIEVRIQARRDTAVKSGAGSEER